jgi:hypothetical protein
MNTRPLPQPSLDGPANARHAYRGFGCLAFAISRRSFILRPPELFLMILAGWVNREQQRAI